MRTKRLISIILVMFMTCSCIMFSYAAAEENNANDVPTAVASKGTPVLDGKIDQVWNSAKSYPIEKWKRNTKGAIKGQFRALWDEENLYILGEVTDPVLSTTNASPWEQDSFEVFVEESNSKNKAYEFGAYQFRVSCKGEKSGQYRPASEINSVAQITMQGYLVEISIPFMSIKGEGGKILGFDVQINDDPGIGKRDSYMGWYDATGNVANNCSLLANLKLDGGNLPGNNANANPNTPPINTPGLSNNAIFKSPFGLSIKVNDQYQKAAENAVVQNGSTLVPARGLFEALGAQVTWVEATNMVVVLRGKDSVVFKINSNQAKVNNVVKALEQPALIMNDMTMVPIRFVGESLGITVNWDEATQTVGLILPKELNTKVTDSPVTAEPSPKAAVIDVEEPPHNDNLELADSSMTTVYPGESNEILKNPYRGFHVTKASNDGINASSYSSELAKRMSVGYLRVDWSKIEPQEGAYNWKFIDDTIDYLKSINSQVGIGIMAANYNSSTNFGQSTPNWVFTAGAKYTIEANGSLKVPIWDDPIYMEKYGKMIKALKEKYDGNPNVAYFDMRNYGNWGEWHLGGLANSRSISMDSMKKHVDMWAGFKTRVLMMNNTAGYKVAPITQYAMDTLQAGIRRDGTVHMEHPQEHLSMAVGYNQVPACGEWWTTYGGLLTRQAWSPVLYEKVLKEGKPTWLGISIHDEQRFFDECKDLIDRWVNRCGYWFKPVKFSFSNNLGNGAQGKIQFRMKNDGVAPIYANNQNKAYVKVALLDDKNKVLESALLEGINAFNWKPNLYKNEEAVFQFKKNPAGIKLAFGVFTDKELKNPDVKLGTTVKQFNNWYILNDISKEPPIDLANNKIYSASSEGTTPNYGYHEARYAFDGTNDRYWSVEGDAKNQWLMVDLGTQKEFSKVEIKEHSPKITSFKIQYLNGEKWEDAYSGKTIAKEGQSFTFEKKSSNKVRILILEANGGAELTYFKIMK